MNRIAVIPFLILTSSAWGCEDGVVNAKRWSIMLVNPTQVAITMDFTPAVTAIDARLTFRDNAGIAIAQADFDAYPTTFSVAAVDLAGSDHSSEISVDVCVRSVMFEDGTGRQFE